MSDSEEQLKALSIRVVNLLFTDGLCMKDCTGDGHAIVKTPAVGNRALPHSEPLHRDKALGERIRP